MDLIVFAGFEYHKYPFLFTVLSAIFLWFCILQVWTEAGFCICRIPPTLSQRVCRKIAEFDWDFILINFFKKRFTSYNCELCLYIHKYTYKLNLFDHPVFIVYTLERRVAVIL